MTTKTEIINLALSMLSANTITAPTDDSEEAKLANLHYEPARDATLESHDWTFARIRFQPSLDATPPLFGYANQFTIPTEVLRVTSCDRVDQSPGNYRVGDTVYQPEQVDWQREGTKILTNEDVLYCRGTRKVTDEASFSALFVHALAAKLAVLMALPLTQSNTIAQNMAGMFEVFIRDAVPRDAQQGRSKRIRNRSFDVAR